jgi:hypothetical protein
MNPQFVDRYFHKKVGGSKGRRKPVLAQNPKSTAVLAAMQQASSGLATEMRSPMPCG